MNEGIEINIVMDHLVSPEEMAALEGEKLYTLFLRDFLIMPEVDFQEVSAIDPEVLALFN